MTTNSTTKMDDPGPPPYCAVCGHKRVVLPHAQSPVGVCMVCGSVVKPEISVGGEVRPFLMRVSDLTPLPPDFIKFRDAARMQIRKEPVA